LFLIPLSYEGLIFHSFKTTSTKIISQKANATSDANFYCPYCPVLLEAEVFC